MRDDELGKLMREGAGPAPDPEEAWQALPEAARSAMLDDVLAAADEADAAGAQAGEPAPTWADRLRDWFGGWQMPALVVAGAAAAALLVAPPAGNLENDMIDTGIVRPKGSVALTVWRNRDGDVAKVPSGARFKTGDRLRFTVDLPDGGHFMIVGVEADGDVFSAYPLGAMDSKSMKPAREANLPGAVQLDDAPGDEWLHLVSCPDRFKLTDVSVAAGPDTLKMPAGCRVARFEVDKE